MSLSAIQAHRRTLRWAGWVLLILAAFAIRIYRLDHVPLRGDEAYTVVHWTSAPFTDKWEKLLRDEPAPVGAFTMYWLWSELTGHSEFAIRYLSVLGNIAGLAAVITLTKHLLRKRELAALVGVLWALNPHLIWHAQDARIYGVLSALTTLSFYWFVRALESKPEAGQHVWWPYISFQVAALYIYYLEVFWMAALGVYLLLHHRQRLIQAIRAWISVGVLLLPVLIQVAILMFISEYRGNAESAHFSTVFTDFMPTLLFGDSSVPLWMGVIFAVGLIAGLWFVRRRNQDTADLLLSWILIPIALLFLVSLFNPFFRPRYMLTITPALLVGLIAIADLFARRRFCWLPVAAVFLISGVSVVEIYDYFYRDPPKADNWPALAAYVRARSDEGTIVISGAADPALEYYYTGPGDIYFVPALEHTPQADLDYLLAHYEVFLLLNGERTGAIGQFLQSNTQHISGDTYPGVNQYRRWEVNPDEIAYPLDVQFGDLAVLRGYTLLGRTTLMLYWEALDTTQVDYSILVHLQAAPDAPPTAVLDHGISEAIISTRTWTPGIIYRDPIPLPVEIPPGDYMLLIGMYPAGEPADLLPAININSDDGRYSVGSLRLSPP